MTNEPAISRRFSNRQINQFAEVAFAAEHAAVVAAVRESQSKQEQFDRLYEVADQFMFPAEAMVEVVKTLAVKVIIERAAQRVGSQSAPRW